jgi:hypothetical protein
MSRLTGFNGDMGDSSNFLCNEASSHPPRNLQQLRYFFPKDSNHILHVEKTLAHFNPNQAMVSDSHTSKEFGNMIRDNPNRNDIM